MTESIQADKATNSIDTTFASLREQNRAAFIPFIMAGDPTLEATLELVLEMERRGADIVELGVPFSDPIADGPVNQDAAVRSLKNETSLRDVLGLVKRLREKSSIPVCMFTYYNPVLQYGLEAYAEECAKVGVDASLVVDLPPEESDEYKAALDAKGIKTIFLLAPTSTPERMKRVAEVCSGFVYFTSVIGVTGTREHLSDTLEENVKKVRQHVDLPVAVGFGISTPDQAREVSAMADGIVVGSAIVKRIAQHGSDPNLTKIIGDFVESLAKEMGR